ncbi:MAG TPA: DUF4337 family protein [Verrucomicrobiae bacterium]|jgi:hypothetical protein
MASKIEIPSELKKDLSQSKWGKVLLATPIIITVVATMLAGLASSEMTRGQYDRSLAAELQSRAGDQWGYYQAKKLRGAVALNTMDLLAATSEVKPFDASNLPDADAATVAALTKGELPAMPSAKIDGSVNTALNALENSAPEAEITADLANVKDATLADALAAAQQAASDYDSATKTINKTTDALDEKLRDGDKTAYRNFSGAKLRYTVARYDAESKLNSSIGGIYELQVRKANLSADRHRNRSTKFFYGMLMSQLAVIVATFSIAARQKNFLWSVAAAAALAAVSFSVYVFLCM